MESNVSWMYRRAAQSKKEVPADQIALMRKEITKFRKNLLEKQKALQRSKEFDADERLIEWLQSNTAKAQKTDRQVWKTWYRMYELEQSRATSVTGKREIINQSISTLNEIGFTGVNKDNYNTIVRVLDALSDIYTSKVISSDEIIEIVVEEWANDEEFRKLDIEDQIIHIESVIDENLSYANGEVNYYRARSETAEKYGV